MNSLAHHRPGLPREVEAAVLVQERCHAIRHSPPRIGFVGAPELSKIHFSWAIACPSQFIRRAALYEGYHPRRKKSKAPAITDSRASRHYHRPWMLNGRVRNGNGCGHPGLLTGKALAYQQVARRVASPPEVRLHSRRLRREGSMRSSGWLLVPVR